MSLARKTFRDPLAPIAAALLTALAATVLTGCSSDAAEGPGGPPPPAVSVAPAVGRDVHSADEFSGRIEAVESVEIRPRVAGYVHRVNFREGSEVRKGDVLFEIDPRPYRAEFSRAEAELSRARAQAALARSDATRAQKLLAAQAISQEEHDQHLAAEAQAQAAVRAAEAAADAARLNLEFTQVRSPIAGRAGQAFVTEGNLVTPGAPVLTTVVSLDPVHVYFEGDDRVYLRSGDLRAAAHIQVFVGLGHEDGYPHEGRLDFVDNQVDRATGTIRSRAVLPNPDRRFTPGLFARVKLVGGAARAAVLIDDKAILTDQDRKYVYVLGENDRAERRDVKIGALVDGLRVVTDGLAAGEPVIVHGVQKVFFPGMPVQPQRIAMGDPAPTLAPTGPQVAAEQAGGQDHGG